MNEELSALFDDELDRTAGIRLANRISGDPALLEEWHLCSLIGAAMRGDSLDRSAAALRFHERLEGEPTVLCPGALRRSQSTTPAVWAVAASVAGVAVVAAAAVALQPVRTFEVATVETTLRSVGTSARGGGAEEFMLAHQGVSPSGALNGFSHYARTVALASADGSGRR